MATRAAKIKLGAFLGGAILLLLTTLFYLIGSQVFTNRPEYIIHMRDSVHGLERGSPVKLRGVRVGAVESLRIAPDDVEVVEILISVNPGTPIKVDHKAVMTMQGITGLKFLELIGGTEQAADLEPGGEIQAGQNLLDQLSGDVAGISRQVAELLSRLLAMTGPENQDRIDTLLQNVGTVAEQFGRVASQGEGTLQSTQQILDENRRPLRSLVTNLQRSAAHLDQTLAGVDRTLDTVRLVLDGADIPKTARELRETSTAVKTTFENLEGQRAMDALLETTNSLKQLLDRSEATLAQNQEAIRSTLENLRRASSSLKETTRTFQEKPMIQVFGDEPPERKLP